MTSLPAAWATAAIAELVQSSVHQSAPAAQEKFTYIEISSIDPGTKRVTETKALTGANAPTRARQRVRADDVLVSMTRPNLNTVALLGAEYADGAICSTGFQVLRSVGVAPAWLYYAARTPAFVDAMSAIVQGVLYPAVRPKDVLAFRIPVPPLAEQRRIVSAIEEHFTRLDATVAALRRAQANLKRYRASVLKAACEGRLVPTEAELARHEGRDYEPASALLERIAALRQTGAPGAATGKMGATRRRDLPVETSEVSEGWAAATWAQVGKSQNGRSFPSGQYQDEGVRLLRPGNLHVSGRVAWTEDNTKCLPTSWAERFPDYLVEPGEIVMNLTAQSLRDEFLGRVCMTGPGERCLLNQRIARLTPVLQEPRFVLYSFKAWAFRRFVDSLNTGSLIQHMFTSQLDDFVLLVPPLPEQQRIVAEVERRLSVADQMEASIAQQLARAERLRQAILKRAFEGRLVPQDPNDETASTLMQRIHTEPSAPHLTRSVRRPASQRSAKAAAVRLETA